MKIVLDLHWLKPGWTGGIETLARGFLESLVHQKIPHQFFILVPLEALIHSRVPYHPGLHWIPVNTPRMTLRRLQGKSRFSGLMADVALAFSGYIQPELMHLPFIIIVPDLQHEELPQFFDLNERIERQFIFTRAIRGAIHCITLSQYTRRVLMKRYNLPSHKVSVAYPGVASRFFTIRPNSVEPVLRQYNLPLRGYFFYPAHTWPHKNHRVLLYALTIIRQAGFPVPLVVCTGQPKNAHEDFLHTIHSLDLKDRVRWLGYLPDEDIPALYAGALALVYPSKYEGFGFPLLEAMATGCPIISSRTTCLPEIAGDAALLLDPDDSEAWAEAMVELMDHPDRQQMLQRKGRSRVKAFSWEQFTTTILTILEQHGQQKSNPVVGNMESRAIPISSWTPRWHTVWKGYLRLRKWVQSVYRWLWEQIDSRRAVPARTRRLLYHLEPWWDGWVGPVMVLPHKLEHPADHLIIRGEHNPPHPGESLSLTVCLDGERVATHQIDEVGDFDLTIYLSRMLEPGVHIVTVKAHPWWIAHHRWNNHDFRPLAWRIIKLKFC